MDSLSALRNVRSSYALNNYGWLFYSLAHIYRPQVCIELGVLDGYSLICTAAGLLDNKAGIIHGYDLWEDYPYNHARMDDVQNRVDSVGLTDFVKLHKADAYDVPVPEMWADNSLDWIHVDISNDGDVVEWALNVWRSKLRDGGLLLLEGGSEERDQVEWMVKYGKEPIAPVLAAWDDVYEMFTFEPMPSLTVCRKWGGDAL